MILERGLELKNVTVHYDNTPVLNGLNLVVRDGETVAILGASGSGKSTLLRVIAGLEPTKTGSVSWNGKDITGLAPHKRGIGMMFQDGQLFEHMSVSRNIEYGLRMQKLPKEERSKRVAELLELIGMNEFGDRAVTTLSGGQAQRVALARSLAPAPGLLLLDEPLSALDRQLREQLGSDLKRILSKTKTTALFVTHDEDEAQSVADRVLRFNDVGQLEEIA